MGDSTGKLIECPCGVILRGPGNDEVIAAARDHAKANHDMDLSEEQALAMARPA